MIFKSLSKIYPNGRGIHSLSLSLPKTGIVAVLGPNGSGKSTLFKLILGLLEPTEGMIENKYKRVAYVPERRALYLDLTVKEHFKLMASLKKIHKDEIESQWQRISTLFQLKSIHNENIATLSKGNQQKVQFALAWMDDPECFVLDEPFTGLDFENIRVLKKAIHQAYRRGRLIFVSSHQYEELEDLFTHVLILKDGVCQKFASIHELHRDITGYEISVFPDIPVSLKKREDVHFIMQEGRIHHYRIEDFKTLQKLVQKDFFYRMKIEKTSLKGLVEKSLDESFLLFHKTPFLK